MIKLPEYKVKVSFVSGVKHDYLRFTMNYAYIKVKKHKTIIEKGKER